MKHRRDPGDIEVWYVSLAARQVYIHAVLTETGIAVENLKKFNDARAALRRRLCIRHDFGTQIGKFCSKRHSRSCSAYYKRINDWSHANPAGKAQPLCGAIEPFLELLASGL
jgi:hypothetical protein